MCRLRIGILIRHCNGGSFLLALCRLTRKHNNGNESIVHPLSRSDPLLPHIEWQSAMREPVTVELAPSRSSRPCSRRCWSLVGFTRSPPRRRLPHQLTRRSVRPAALRFRRGKFSKMASRLRSVHPVRWAASALTNIPAATEWAPMKERFLTARRCSMMSPLLLGSTRI